MGVFVILFTVIARFPAMGQNKTYKLFYRQVI